jgi:hypothetical protein
MLVTVALGIGPVALLAMVTIHQSAGVDGLRLSGQRIGASVVFGRNALPVGSGCRTQSDGRRERKNQ